VIFNNVMTEGESYGIIEYIRCEADHRVISIVCALLSDMALSIRKVLRPACSDA